MAMPMILIRGLPGSGKSTFANAIRDYVRNHTDYTPGIFETDNFFVDSVNHHDYHFDPKILGLAHNWNLAEVYRFCRDYAAPCIVANTFTTECEMEPYIEIAKHFGRPVVYIWMDNAFENVHGVPKDTLAKMAARFQINDTRDVRVTADSEETALKYIFWNISDEIFQNWHTRA